MDIPKNPFKIPNISDIPSQLPAFIPWRLFVFAVSLVASIVMINFVIRLGYMPAVQTSITSTNHDIQAKQADFDQINKKEVSRIFSKMYFLSNFVGNHIIVSPIFSFLNAKTLPQVFYTAANFDATKLTLEVSGSADTIADAVRQVFIFESSKEVIGVSVKSVQINKTNGRVDFGVTLTLNKGFITFQNQNAK